jgi:hypothetical protein
MNPMTTPLICGWPSAKIPLGPARIMSQVICPNIERHPAAPSHDFKNSVANALSV